MHRANTLLNNSRPTYFLMNSPDAQQSAIGDIQRDVGGAVPMNRLLQGDVGCGKTAVAIVALAMALHNGKQAAMMAPTSILAEQHYRAVCDAFSRVTNEDKPVVQLLTGAIGGEERESIYRGIADGSIDIVVGTHAVIQAGVGLQRFGDRSH